MFEFWFRIPFWQRVLAGFVLGGLAGWTMGPSAATWFQPLGTLYITLIRMIAVPLVFFNLLAGLTTLTDLRVLGRLTAKLVSYFVATKVIATKCS